MAKTETFYNKARQHPKSQEDERTWARPLLTESMKLVEEKRFAEALIKLTESVGWWTYPIY